MRRLILFTLNSIQGFIAAVEDDDGFFVARSHIYRAFRIGKGADLICPMSAGKVSKLYFEKK